MLMDELRTWPDVTERAMFGMQAFYRGRNIFAALPKSRAVGQSSFIFKLEPVSAKLHTRLQADPRIDMSEGHRWFPFELAEESDIRPALEWLQLAYENAAKATAKNRKKTR